MVFVIQHTQARQQAATQRKLDEILQALPGADNALMALNTLPMMHCAPPATRTARPGRLR
jgi:low affinity Fe/Cu permease